MANCSIAYDCSSTPLDMFAVIQSVTLCFRRGAELKSGQPTKSLCQSARYFSRSFAWTYSQYAFSRFQTCVSSLAESCAISRSYSAAVRTAITATRQVPSAKAAHMPARRHCQRQELESDGVEFIKTAAQQLLRGSMRTFVFAVYLSYFTLSLRGDA